jgi:hypothetical protein
MNELTQLSKLYYEDDFSYENRIKVFNKVIPIIQEQVNTKSLLNKFFNIQYIEDFSKEILTIKKLVDDVAYTIDRCSANEVLNIRFNTSKLNYIVELATKGEVVFPPVYTEYLKSTFDFGTLRKKDEMLFKTMVKQMVNEKLLLDAEKLFLLLKTCSLGSSVSKEIKVANNDYTEIISTIDYYISTYKDRCNLKYIILSQSYCDQLLKTSNEFYKEMEVIILPFDSDFIFVTSDNLGTYCKIDDPMNLILDSFTFGGYNFGHGFLSLEALSLVASKNVFGIQIKN